MLPIAVVEAAVRLIMSVWLAAAYLAVHSEHCPPTAQHCADSTLCCAPGYERSDESFQFPHHCLPHLHLLWALNPCPVSFHLTVLAKDAEGYRNLVKLTTASHLHGMQVSCWAVQAWQEGQFWNSVHRWWTIKLRLTIKRTMLVSSHTVWVCACVHVHACVRVPCRAMAPVLARALQGTNKHME